MSVSVRSRRLIAAGAILLLGATTGIAPVFAVGPGANKQPGITVSPQLKQITLGPGLLQAFTTVKVTNNTSYTLNADVKLLDFSALNETGGISLEQAGSTYGLAKWMSLDDNSNLILAPDQTVTLRIEVDNRADLTPGGHYGAVVINASSAQNGSQGNGVGFNEQIASLVFLNKSGGDHYGLVLQSVNVDKSGGLPSDVTLLFKSTGNVYVVPHGFINVLDPKGKLVERGIINQEDTLIIQGTSRQYITLMQPVANANLTGRYKIVSYYRYDGQSGYNTNTYYFDYKTAYDRFLIPGIAGVVIILCSAAAFLVRKKSHSPRKREII